MQQEFVAASVALDAVDLALDGLHIRATVSGGYDVFEFVSVCRNGLQLRLFCVYFLLKHEQFIEVHTLWLFGVVLLKLPRLIAVQRVLGQQQR